MWIGPDLPGPLPPTAVSTPAAVQFDGVPASLIVGDRVNLNLATAGNIKSYAWSVMPPGTVGLKVYDGGTKADFTSRFPRDLCVLGGGGRRGRLGGPGFSRRSNCGSIAHRRRHNPPFRLRLQRWLRPEAKPSPSSDPNELLRRWAAEVKSSNRRAAIADRQHVRQAAGAIDSSISRVPTCWPTPRRSARSPWAATWEPGRRGSRTSNSSIANSTDSS